MATSSPAFDDDAIVIDADPTPAQIILPAAPAVTVLCYRVHDTRTGQQIGRDHKTRRTANRSADRHNLQYGAHRYSVRTVWSDATSSEF